MLHPLLIFSQLDYLIKVVYTNSHTLSFSHYKSMGANDPRGVASLDPRGLIGRIYVGDH